MRMADGHHPLATEVVARAPLFLDVPPSDYVALLDGASIRRLAPGTRLLSVGQLNTSLFIVLDGALDVLLPGGEGPHVRMLPGECVGELSLIDGQPASADIVAAESSTLLELPYDRVQALIENSGVFARNLLRVLTGRVRHDDTALGLASDRRRHYERLSMADALTSLHNRRWFDAVFPAHLERLQREERPAALLMADADQFKDLNDTHGHAAGDDVLRRIAAALATGLRPDDPLARYGGEEFAALVADVDLAAALLVAERLRETVASLPPADGLSCTISIGVALAAPGEAFVDLVQRADAALFRAKEAGRNKVSA